MRGGPDPAMTMAVGWGLQIRCGRRQLISTADEMIGTPVTSMSTDVAQSVGAVHRVSRTGAISATVTTRQLFLKFWLYFPLYAFNT